MSLFDMSTAQLAHFDQLQAEINHTWQQRGLDLTGRYDEEIVAVRSALLTLEVLRERANRHWGAGCHLLPHQSWESAFIEMEMLLQVIAFPPEDGFVLD